MVKRNLTTHTKEKTSKYYKRNKGQKRPANILKERKRRKDQQVSQEIEKGKK